MCVAHAILSVVEGALLFWRWLIHTGCTRKARPWVAVLPLGSQWDVQPLRSQIKKPVIATDIQLKIKQRYRREAPEYSGQFCDSGKAQPRIIFLRE